MDVTYAMAGQIENSILCYTASLDIQRQVLGEMDSHVGETYKYLAEAHVQALEFDEAKKIVQRLTSLKNGLRIPLLSLFPEKCLRTPLLSLFPEK